jgi:hypothetical protein
LALIHLGTHKRWRVHRRRDKEDLNIKYCLPRGRLANGLPPIHWFAMAAALLILTFPAFDPPTGLFAVVVVAGLVARLTLARRN